MRPLPAHDTRRGLAPSVQRLRAGWQILSARQRALAPSATPLPVAHGTSPPTFSTANHSHLRAGASPRKPWSR